MKRAVLYIFTLFLVASTLAQGLSVTPNQPIGEGKGIFPGRVVWAMDPEVSKWDGATGRWWDEGNIDRAFPNPGKKTFLYIVDGLYGIQAKVGAPQVSKSSSRNCDNYLKEGAGGKNVHLGDYRPNGVKTGSLGVFEHWNNPQDKRYSRNLGKKEGIELITIK